MIAATYTISNEPGMSAKDAALLKSIREARANPRAALTELAKQVAVVHPANRSCHGKKRVRTAEFAAAQVKRSAARGVPLEFYFCAYCNCYHYATPRPK